MDKEYKIISCVKSGGYESKFGPMNKYTLTLDDNGQQITAELSQKPTTAIPQGTITGTIADDPKYGNKFKKASKVGGGGFSGGGNKKDPETQKAIIRQNALTNGVNFCIAKHKKEELNEKEVVRIANYFVKYTSGAMDEIKEAMNKLPQPPKGVSTEDINF